MLDQLKFAHSCSYDLPVSQRQVNLAGAVHFTGHNHFTRAMEALFVSALTLSGDLCVGGDFPYLDN